MIEKRYHEIDSVLGNHVIPFGEIGIRFHGPHEKVESTRRNSKVKTFLVPRPVGEPDEPVEDGILDEYALHFELDRAERIFFDERWQIFQGVLQARLASVTEHFPLYGIRGISDFHKAGKSVALSFWQRESTVVLDGVLGSDNQVVTGKFVFGPSERNFPFLHALQKRALGFRMHSVDFVDQDQFIEYRTLLYRKRFLFEVVDFASQNILGQAVGSSLDPGKRIPDEFGKSFGDRGFPNTGKVLYQDVPMDEQGNLEYFRDFRLLEHEGKERGSEILEFFVDQGRKG